MKNPYPKGTLNYQFWEVERTRKDFASQLGHSIDPLILFIGGIWIGVIISTLIMVGSGVLR
jgi:hypothetical protein